jgi:hypothetical protein
MPIEINIDTPEEQKQEEEQNTRLKMKLNIRRTLDGDLVIADHPDIDIVVQPEKMRVVCFPKTMLNDEVYAAQNRFFEYMTKNGIITRDSVRGGNVYGSLEGTIGTPTKPMAIDEIATFSVGKFIEEERPSFMYQKAMEEREEEIMTDPEAEDSTELGEVPQEKVKGSIIPHRVRRYVAGF